jgi:hypothetical protein
MTSTVPPGRGRLACVLFLCSRRSLRRCQAPPWAKRPKRSLKMRVFNGPMSFVLEGQADRSLARSAWVNATPKSRPVGCDWCRCARRFDDWSDEISNATAENIYVGGGISWARSYRTLRDGSLVGRFPRHFVPGYDQPVPPGQKPSPIEAPHNYLSAYGLKPWAFH